MVSVTCFTHSLSEPAMRISEDQLCFQEDMAGLDIPGIGAGIQQ
jgi:hypothetical protein